MDFLLKIGSQTFRVDHKHPIHISIPLLFNGPQPNTYDIPIAKSQAYQGEGWVGDVREGSGCNFETYEFTPHCNGTHTECIGHISEERISVHHQLKDSLIPSTVISVEPQLGREVSDQYLPELDANDLVITKATIENALNVMDGFLDALIIRTLPNSETKKERRYAEKNPAFFTIEAMEYIRDLGVKHLLIDLPSVDRTFDEGRLTAHHIFWEMPLGSHTVDIEKVSEKSITEMIFVPNEVLDGHYLLNLQMAAFVSDASPSRPILYELEAID
ncbi:cyclase family protein [Sediminitomix flava]|uniref:Putative cyclase n=1 Tax=Sediminitomix flava TaxID=379075 RepID=A0A315ZBM0_SEDFL|nr:cyclase family protein [Sediminitomix flava]PWJ42114.1 putative cyclase [Sediminitomix flava]